MSGCAGFSNCEEGASTARGQVPVAGPPANECTGATLGAGIGDRHEVAVLIADCSHLRHLWCSLVDAVQRCPNPRELNLQVCLLSRTPEVWPI